MTTLRLHPPLEIGPRLMPAVTIAPGTDHAGRVSLDPSDLTWYIDLADGTEVSGGDFHHPYMRQEPSDYIREAMGAFLCFLSAFAEAIEYEFRTGRPSDNRDLFPRNLREWAYLNSDEIGMLSYDLEEDDDDDE